MRPESLAFLIKLLETPSPSSGEARGQRVWIDYVSQFTDDVETDAYGNAFAYLGNREAKPRIMVAGHGDEIGFQVQYIDDDGYIYVDAVGGPDVALARGQRVYIHTANGPVLGVFGSIAVHMQDRSKKGEVPEISDLYIDIGAKDGKEAAELVGIGDLITYVAGPVQLRGDVYVARAADNRIGSFVAAEVLRICAEKKADLAPCLVAVSTIQEENGLYGAQMVGYSVNPDAALVVDVGHATDIPGANKRKFGAIKLGKGAILSKGSVNHPVLLERLEAVAKEKEIAYQRGIDARRSGTDAEAIFVQRGGIPSVSIGVPNRYMHTPVESIHLGDLEKLAEWLAYFTESVQKDEKFKVKI
ncbi:MAG: M20/M25/M40 family metallo-hydrolase [Candidatus Methylacidiphilales bacterium]|nr:M20/M25/M40 family metallo-hydrolase [Candidatus Methylacidiphilales bacterium]